MKNKKNKRILSLILAIFMVLTMVPMNAYSIDTAVSENEGLEDLLIYTGYSSSMQSTAILGKANGDYPDRELFDQQKTEYVLEKSDSIIDTNLRFAVVPKEDGSKVNVVYSNATTDSAIKELTTVKDVSKHIGTNWANCITKPGKNFFSIVVTPPVGSLNKEVVYEFTVYTKPTLTSLELYDASNKLYLDKDFKSDVTTYSVLVSENTKNITFNAIKKYDNYEITFDGDPNPEVNIEEKDKVEINVSIGEGSDKRSTKYTVNLNKAETYSASIKVNPNDSIFKLYDSHGVLVLDNAEGQYSDLLSGEEYTYVVTKYGYVSKTGTLTGSKDLDDDGKLNIELEKADKPEVSLPSYTGEWTSFRGNPENMGITNAKTPTSIETAALKWAVKYGSGWSAAPTPPLIINDNLYIAMNKNVLIIDKETGEELKRSPDMAAAVGFALNPITYAEGMLFVPVGSGQIQALRADTLELLWVSEKLGGQTVTPVTYNNGYIYTGTWNSETKTGTYFCLSVTDEDPTKNNETKLCTWKLDHTGGFYWAGAYATDEYVIFGSDDGYSEGSYVQMAVLYSVNPITGDIIDTIEGIKGDIRSSISFDKTTNKAYFATKGGLFCTVKVNDDGTFDDDTFKTLDLGGMCTGTPLVYNDRAYIGSSGVSQFAKGKLNVIDLSKESPKLAYAAELPGYPQASALLSTAYEDTAYVYITYNSLPGGIYVIEDKVDQISANGYDLFIPDKGQQQYSIASLVAGSDGTIYYKNDSCYLMAVGNNTNTNTVTIAAYDYTAVDNKLSGASSNGMIIEKSVELIDGMSAKEAILSVFNEENIEITIQDTDFGPYISSVNNLAAGTGGGMSGWLTNYNNDDFSNLGLDTIELKNGNSLALHYSVNPDSSTDDVGNGWYGLPIVKSFTLQGQNVVMSKETSYDEFYNATTTYYIHSKQGSKEKIQGYGTEKEPFIIPISLPTKTDLSALTAEYTTSLNPHYRIVTGLDGEQNYTNGLSFSISTLGGKYKTYYKVLIQESDDNNNGDNPDIPTKSYITLSIDKNTIKKGYVLRPTKFEFKKGESVWDVLKKVLDDEGIDYKFSFTEKYNSVYIESIDGDGEFDHGSGSGWMYNVNGWYPNYGASLYKLKDGDVVQWRYTTNLGIDLGEDITKWEPKINISGIKDNEEVTKEKITVTITAKDGNGKKIVPTVQLNDEKVNGSNDKYILELKEGTNKLLITAKDSMNNIITEELRIKYVIGGGSTGVGGQENSSGTQEVSSSSGNQTKYNDESIISSWAKESINRATNLGIVQGYDGLFNPQSNITRAEFTKIIVGVLNLDITEEKSIDFKDISVNDWFYSYINAAYKANIVAGMEDEFKPNDNITREQMAVIVVRALGLKAENLNTALNDLNLISDWAKIDVETAISYGLMIGDNNNFNPNSFATREMATVVAMRVYDYVNNAAK